MSAQELISTLESDVNKINSLKLAQQIRAQCLKMVTRSGASHIASALSVADIVAVLYADIMNYDSEYPSQTDRDRFLLSKGHACTAVYSALAELGFFPRVDLERYGDNGSYLMNHISHHVPGVEFSAGALGHLLPVASGKALFAKKKNKQWKIYVVLSDGELNEGSNWEAIMFAAHHKLGNLTAVIDKNNYQSFTTTQETLNMDPLEDKFKSFGWNVHSINGHSHPELHSAFLSANNSVDTPSVVIANTVKGKGVSFMENLVEWHYKNPSDKQLSQALSEVFADA
jgi:transketolase